ncbi:MAG: Crp/Fnr family transcriptional regulator [Crocinitomicaceae bacterium]|nr:Crp/Fnr family transcriptional regulator [Crocinitomicaceae bacterium]
MSIEEVLNDFDAFSQEDIQRGMDIIKRKAIRKNEILIHNGESCNWVAFLNSGIVRNFYYNNQSEEVTYCFTFPGTFFCAYSSFISGKPSFENIQALTDLDLMILAREDLNELIESNHNWLKFAYSFSQNSYLYMEERLLTLQKETAEERYTNLVKNNPEILQSVPLKYISSYLGISQRHLSRLRKNILL